MRDGHKSVRLQDTEFTDQPLMQSYWKWYSHVPSKRLDVGPIWV